ncbi:MAG TPA: ADOP family duplicated permease [Vicinamibacterales bacterium]|nr:ADOP family duplicated permease [Vicinamibacterales bacterium]
MRWLASLKHRWRALVHGTRLDEDLEREIRAHIDDEVDDLVARGVAPVEARRLALLRFGSRGQVTEECRESRGVSLVTSLSRDVAYGWRALVRQPVLLAAASVSIALGVGANLSIYAVANDLLLSVPTARAADRLVHIRTGNGSHVSYQAWELIDASRALDGVAGYQFEHTVNLRVGAESTPIFALLVTPNFFDVVGVPVALGRGFASGDLAGGRDDRPAVVSDAFWRRRMNADPDALGTGLVVNGQPYAVVGILPAGVRSVLGYGFTPDLYLPISRALLPAIDRPREAAVMLIGRLADRQSAAAGRAAMSTVVAAVGDALGDRELRVLTDFAPVGGLAQVHDFEVVGAFFVVVLAVAGLVLVIACANVSGLLLARGTARRREMALRLALGASRGRLLRQLLTEGLLVATLGTLLGLALTGLLALAASRISLPVPLPIVINPAFDLRLLAAALLLTGVSAVLAALLPALEATKPGLAAALREAPASDRRRKLTLRRLLVAGQVAMSMFLLVVTFTFLRNLERATTLDPGFAVDRVLVAQVTFVEGQQGSPEDPAVLRMLERVRRLPGVVTASASEGVPLTLYSGSWTGTGLRVGDASGLVHAEFARNRVGPGYFETLGIGLRGRDFSPADRLGAEPVAIVNETFVREYFGGQDPIGALIVEPRRDGTRTYRVIGVAATSRYRTLGEAESPAIYDPLLQNSRSPRLAHILVRTAGAPAPLLPLVRGAALAADGSAAVDVRPMADALAFAFLPSRIGAALLGVLGVLGTTLAMVGLYGVVSYAVSRRVPEIGVRIALGASRRDVLGLVLRDAARLAAWGVAVGLGLSYLAAPVLGAFLVAGLSASDPASFMWTAFLLLVVCLAAAWAPAWRAARIDPAKALRAE